MDKREQLRQRIASIIITRNPSAVGYQTEHRIDELLELLDTARRDSANEVIEKVRNDYIAWIFATSLGKAYKGATPFGEWKDLAEAKTMRNWD